MTANVCGKVSKYFRLDFVHMEKHQMSSRLLLFIIHPTHKQDIIWLEPFHGLWDVHVLQQEEGSD